MKKKLLEGRGRVGVKQRKYQFWQFSHFLFPLEKSPNVFNLKRNFFNFRIQFRLIFLNVKKKTHHFFKLLHSNLILIVPIPNIWTILAIFIPLLSVYHSINPNPELGVIKLFCNSDIPTWKFGGGGGDWLQKYQLENHEFFN